MNRRAPSVLVVSAVVAMTMASVGGQQTAPPPGAYTAAQAQAGLAAYAQQCAGCHLPDLRGSGDARKPPGAGGARTTDPRRARWGKTALG